MDFNDDNDVSQILRSRFFDLVEEPRRMLPAIEGFEKMPLVPLEKAVEPLVRQIENIEIYASIAKERCKPSPANNLSVDESASIGLYTMEWKPKNQCLYMVLNKNLRDQDRTCLKPWFLYLKLIITSLRKIPSKPCHLFRGVKLDLSQEHPQGQETIWWAFSSCTNSMELLEKPTFLGKTGVRTLFEISCSSAKDIREHSVIKSENELLLLPATLFEIVESFDKGQGLHIVQLKEIEPKFPLLEKGPVANPPISPAPVNPPSFLFTPPKQKSKPAQPISSSIPNAPNDPNRDLERRIAGSQPRSNINLDGQGLMDRDIRAVVDQAIIGKRCRTLSLKNSEITLEGISMLAEGICKSTTLEELDLSNNRLSDEELRPLARELSVNRSIPVEQKNFCGIPNIKELDLAPIKILNLSNNYIGDEGASDLAEVLKTKRTLIQLNLSGNQIRDRGAQLLAYALSHKKTNLKKLDLQNNQLITDSSVKYLIDMINQSRSLNTLWLTNCSLSDDSIQKLRDAAHSKKKFQLVVEP